LFEQKKTTRSKILDRQFKGDRLKRSPIRSGLKMKRQHTILEILFPKVRAEMLRLHFNPPQKERYVRELMGMSGLTLSTVQDELRKLSALQLVTSRRNRCHRFYRANADHPLFPDLVHIVETSERSPQIDRSLVHVPRGLGRVRRRKPRPLPPDRPLRWDLFSKDLKE
jgi:DNA-binding MarR family transcriptional regulator